MTTRIDAHTHVFTLRSILTPEAIRVMTQRIVDMGAPKFLADAVEQLLYDQLSKPHAFNERRLLAALLRKLTGIEDFKKEVENLFTGDLLKFQVEGDLDDLSAEILIGILRKFADRYQGGSVASEIMNVVATLQQSMQPTITDVADHILEPMMDGHPGDDCVIAALMLDIYSDDESPIDHKTYRSQITGTAEAALQRPGRVLPFFGVHPDRPGHLDELRRAVETMGFVGVKLYPSLGYKVDSPEMRRVYQYCVEADLPVLLHCGHGGFYRQKKLKKLCDPAQWNTVLADPDFQALRVCFAHFGGWEALGKRECLAQNVTPDNWGKKIYDFMVAHPNVYTDLAKHVSMFDDPADEQTYFDTMRQLLASPAIGKRILFGTDAWLLRLDMPFDEYLRKWRTAAGSAWDDITVEGPQAFLGFAPQPDKMRGNMRRFVDFMRQNRHRVGGEPAPWLQRVIGEAFSKDRDRPDWNFKRYAVRDTYQFLGPYLRDAHLDRSYKEHRVVPLRDLAYYDPSDPNFVGRCRDMARRFVDFADQRVKYAPGHTFGSTVDMFTDIFKKGDLRLSDVATALDTVLEYPERIT